MGGGRARVLLVLLVGDGHGSLLRLLLLRLSGGLEWLFLDERWSIGGACAEDASVGVLACAKVLDNRKFQGKE